MGLFGDKKSAKGKRPEKKRTVTASQAQANELRVKARRRLVGAIALVLIAVLVVPLLFDDPVPSQQATAPEVVTEPPQVSDPDLALGPETSDPDQIDGPEQGTVSSGTDSFPDDTAADDGNGTVPDTDLALDDQALLSQQPEAVQDDDEDSTDSQDDASDASTDEEDSPDDADSQESSTSEGSDEDAASDSHDDQRSDDGSVALALLEGREPSNDESGSSESEQTQQGQFILQIAAYSAQSDADDRQAKLADSGVTNAYVEESQGSDKTTWRLRVGPFSTRDAAQAAQARLRTLGYDNSMLLTQ